MAQAELKLKRFIAYEVDRQRYAYHGIVTVWIDGPRAGAAPAALVDIGDWEAEPV